MRSFLLSVLLALAGRDSLALTGSFAEQEFPPQVCAIGGFFKLQGEAMFLDVVCTGSLIAQDRVLTAAHCKDELRNHSKILVSCGKRTIEIHDLEQAFVENPGFEALNSPKVQALGFAPIPGGEKDRPILPTFSDVGVIHLGETIPKDETAAITLAPSEKEADLLLSHPEKCSVYGVGIDNDGAVASPHAGKLELLSPQDLHDKFGAKISAHYLVIGPHIHAELGDSGGPVFCIDPSGKIKQTALLVSGQTTMPMSEAETIGGLSDWIQKQ